MATDNAKKILDDFVKEHGNIDKKKFKIFYGPLEKSKLFVIGANPGGNPEKPDDIANYTEIYKVGHHDFVDEQYPLAAKMKDLLMSSLTKPSPEKIAAIPTTNASFFRSPRMLTPKETRQNRSQCQPYLKRMLAIAMPEVIICYGMDTFRYLNSFMANAKLISQAAPPPADGQYVFYRHVRGQFQLMDAKSISIIGFHHPSGYRWSWAKWDVLKTELGKALAEF